MNARRTARWVVGAVALALLGGCTADGPGPGPDPSAPAADRPDIARSGSSPSVAATRLRSPTPAARPTDSPTGSRRPRFSASVQRLGSAVRGRMRGVSWRPGCPVPLGELRLVTVRFTTFRHGSRVGQLVIHRAVAGDVVRVFRKLYRARYPIRRLRPVEAYGGSDRRSMAANNTSGFNCRGVPGSASWSQHAFGLAIDINPVQNPYVPAPGDIQPPRGRRFVDRSRQDPAMIHEGDAVVRAFDSIGWGWGGRWTSLKDWQHFSRTGR